MQVVVDRPHEDILRPNLELPPVFQRLYVGFASLRTGFVGGCRPIIILDGCHLKGIYGGQLLCALGRDGNDNYFPISWAAVEAESKDSWGLVPGFEEVMPNVEHRFCIRHIYSNFIAKFKGIELRDLLWKAAAAGIVKEF
ncbi:hypothetical protein ACSBR2_008511 [Camellia fascicularis]